MGFIGFIIIFAKIALKLIKVLYKLGLVNSENLTKLGIDADDIDLGNLIG